MCLKVTAGPFIAEKDISVLKIINRDDSSIYQAFPYTPGMEYKTHFVNENSPEGTSIYQGFHSYDKAQVSVKRHNPFPVRDSIVMFHRGTPVFLDYISTDTSKLVEFTIPAGASYYFGDRGDMVSDTIIAGTLQSIEISEYFTEKE